jgi:hypothetical protein
MVTRLIDRKTLHHAPQWLKDDPENIEGLREWTGLDANTQFTTLSRLKEISKDKYKSALRGAGPLGFSTSGPHGYEWNSVRKVMILSLLGSPPIPAVIIYCRDMDQQSPERTASIEAAIEAMPNRPFAVVPALANPKREAWILNGFIAKNAPERRRLKSLRDELKFDPCEKAENLDASAHGALKDAKRVLKKLTEDNRDRELECLNAPWKTLRKRGKSTGLTDFLEHVKERIVPVITGEPA